MQWVDTLHHFNLTPASKSPFCYVKGSFFNSMEVIGGMGFSIGNGNLFIRFAPARFWPDEVVKTEQFPQVTITYGRATNFIKSIEVNFYDAEDRVDAVLRRINYAITSMKCRRQDKGYLSMVYRLIRDNEDVIRNCVDKTTNDIVKN